MNCDSNCYGTMTPNYWNLNATSLNGSTTTENWSYDCSKLSYYWNYGSNLNDYSIPNCLKNYGSTTSGWNLNASCWKPNLSLNYGCLSCDCYCYDCYSNDYSILTNLKNYGSMNYENWNSDCYYCDLNL